MNILDDQIAIRRLDKANVLTSIEALSGQAQQAWDESTKIKIPTDYKNCQNMVIVGMGGSAFGARVIKSVFAENLKIPLDITSNYRLPGYINERSLVLLASYSGGTEEVLSCAQKAKRKKAKVLGITSGGKLKKFLQDNQYPGYFFLPKNNPSQQPRLGQGYMILGEIGLLSNCGMIAKTKVSLNSLLTILRKNNQILGIKKPTTDNQAKRIAKEFKGKIPIFVSGGFLQGSIHAMRNSLHESAKNFADYFVIPELNHHLMEGLRFAKENLVFLILISNFYSPKIEKRVRLTEEVILKNGIKVYKYNLLGEDKLSQALELIHLGGYLSYYLAILNKVNPATLPWVDYFKKKLAE